MSRSRYAGLAIIVAGVILFAFGMVAWAHTPKVSVECGSATVNLTKYNTRAINTVEVFVDGNYAGGTLDFGVSFNETYTFSKTEDHVFRVHVAAWDDPTGSHGWSFDKSWKVEACETTTSTTQATTTTTQPTTTTTEATTTTTTTSPSTTTTQPSTTTTEPSTTTTAPSTTTTQPDRYICSHGQVVAVGPDHPDYENASDHAGDPVCTTTTTTPEVLPFTGPPNIGMMIVAGLALLTLGGLALRTVRE